MGDMWRLADMLREYRGDAHTAAWTSAGLDATEIGLLTELYWGLPMRTYVRTRAWSDEQLDAARGAPVARGLVADGALTDDGRDAARVDRGGHRRPVRGHRSTRSATTLDELIGLLDAVGRGHPRRRRLPAPGPARPRAPPLANGRALAEAQRPVLGARGPG